MNTTGYLIVAVLVGSALYVGIRSLFRAIQKYRGTRIVICPETGSPTIVEVDALHAALTSVAGTPDIRLEACSRWPIKENCGQECIANLGLPSECLVRSMLMKWYAGKICVLCGRVFGEVHWIDHKPALQSPEGLLVEWQQIKIEILQQVLSSYLPVCWDCFTAQTFLHEHPELVVYRPWREGIERNVGRRRA
ncbi:MAG TPA: hypothetical protein VJ180_15970 [Pyrinomonadaceae bacterium]|nr:hypothetical protein [Pyrinomonadaceae bacterium]